MARRFRANVPHSTIHSWIRQFTPICTFAKLRSRYSPDPDEVIHSRLFTHKQQYKFAFHRLKTNIFCKRLLPQLRRYLWWVTDNCPNHLFQESSSARCSDANLPALTLQLVRKDTNAIELARLALILCKRNRDRHETIQNFMLANDSATIAVEIPVFLHPHEARDLQLAGALTGHIDVLQVRGNRVWILDYKPEARKESARSIRFTSTPARSVEEPVSLCPASGLRTSTTRTTLRSTSAGPRATIRDRDPT
jgi:hypothetical protein